MMKRWLLLVTTLAVLLTACGRVSDVPTGGVPADTTSTTTTTTPTTAPSRVTVDGITYVGDADAGLVATDFELPLRGSTGFASVETALYSDSARTALAVTLAAGDAFTVLSIAAEDTWQVRIEDGTVGYVENTCCYLNIADVIPSIVLDNTNSYASAFYSSGYELPDITGNRLYDAKEYNPRLGQEEFLVACNWKTVKKLYVAQQIALESGYTLVINEAFRPMDVQLDIAATLQELYDTVPEVKEGIEAGPWHIGWFIANRPSTHQMGCAVDTSLAKVTEITYRMSGDYRYRAVTGTAPCTMPTPIHELSAAAVSLSKPVDSNNVTAWQSITPATSMTEDALLLRTYCAAAGLSPLASEWWHFNDLETKGIIGDRFTTDPFYLDTCLSEIP